MVEEPDETKVWRWGGTVLASSVVHRVHPVTLGLDTPVLITHVCQPSLEQGVDNKMEGSSTNEAR